MLPPPLPLPLPLPPLQMIELLDHLPRSVATTGRHARELFTREGALRHIHRLNYWPLHRVLEEKYKFTREEVRWYTAVVQGRTAGATAAAAVDCLHYLHAWSASRVLLAAHRGTPARACSCLRLPLHLAGGGAGALCIGRGCCCHEDL